MYDELGEKVNQLIVLQAEIIQIQARRNEQLGNRIQSLHSELAFADIPPMKGEITPPPAVSIDAIKEDIRFEEQRRRRAR